MRKIIVQHCTKEQQSLFDITKPINQAWAARMGFEYVSDDTRRCPNRTIWWEKIAFLRAFLPTIEDGCLVVWEDADSVNIKDESFANALPPTGIFGMVQNRGGLDFQELINWYNAGVIVMINCPDVRDFLDRVWVRPDDTDEAAIVAELKQHGWEIGNGIRVSSLRPKWNCWKNNEHIHKDKATNCGICEDTVVKSWHGIQLEKKFPEIKKFVDNMRK